MINTGKKSRNMNSDEYQFPQDEYMEAGRASASGRDADSQREQASAKDHAQHAESDSVAEGDTAWTEQRSKGLLERLPLFQNKRVVGVLVVSLVALIGFKIASSSSHRSQAVKHNPVVQEAPPTVAPSSQSLEAAANGKIEHLSQALTDEQNTIDELRTEVAALNVTVKQAEGNNQKMNQMISLLNQQVQRLTDQLKQAKHPSAKQLPSPELTYRLRALIAGRAWVEGSDGSSTSVSVGDYLKDYGMVKMINTDIGKVITSSGKIITYNANGN